MLIVRASSTGSGWPRSARIASVRPVGTRIVDEAWLAWVDQGTMIQPTAARGLAWIDPGRGSGLCDSARPGFELARGTGLALDRRTGRRAGRSRADRAGAQRVDSRRLRGSIATGRR